MPIRKLAKSGKAEDLAIPATLPYAAALAVLVSDLRGTGISFDPDMLYSEETVELENFVSSLVYRFISEDNRKILVYEILDRPNGIYREVEYDGTILRSFWEDAEFGSFVSAESEVAHRARRKLTLG